MKPLILCSDLLDEAHATQVGRSIEVRPGEAPETVIRVQGPDQRTQMLTATMGIERLAGLPGTGAARLVTAILRWGAGGAQLTAELDWLHGTIVSVPGSYLEVLARHDGAPAAAPARVSATMGYGPRAGSGCACTFRTLDYGTLSGVPSSHVVPSWATSGVVLFNAVGAATVDLKVVDDANGPMFTMAGVAVGTEFPIPNGAATVELTATGTVNASFIRFALAL
jgi:hypothetical protein